MSDTGRYVFKVDNLDDGVRVYLDNTLILDQWSGHSGASYSTLRDLTAGEHTVKVEYYQGGGESAIKFSYNKVLADSGTWGTDGYVYTSALANDGTLYFGGYFHHVGPVTGTGAFTNNTNGKVLATSSYPMISDGSVLASTPDGSGGYYIGGSFLFVAGLYHPYLAHIRADGSFDASWNPVPNSTVYALAYASSTVYVGGDFNNMSGQTRYYIAAIDTSGNVTGWNPQASAPVRALSVSGSTVYVGGYFDNIGDASRNGIAALDVDTGLSSSWNPTPNYGTHVNAISAPAGTSTVYIGGSFTSVNSTTRHYLAAIAADGSLTDWAPQPNGEVYALAHSGSTLYVGGNFGYVDSVARNNIAALDTDSVSSPVIDSWNPNTNASVRTLAVSDSSLYFGGDFTTVGGVERNYLAAVGASNGSLLPWNPGSSESMYTISPSGSVVYVGGSSNLIGSRVRNFAASLDPATGEVTDWNPNLNSDLYSIAFSSSTVYLGGDFTTIGGENRSYIGAVNTTDGAVTSWNPGADDNIMSLVLSGDTVYAGGYFLNIGGSMRSHLAALDINTDTNQATSWNPSLDDTVYALTLKDSTLYTGGRFRHVGAQARSGLAVFNLNTGDLTSYIGNVAYSSGTSYINAIAVSGNTLYVGGGFQYAGTGGAPRNNLAALDLTTGAATSWNPNVNSEVKSINVYGNTVYVGGSFGYVGDLNRQYLVAINATDGLATDWNPNPSNTVMTLARRGTTLYAGGYFNTIEQMHLSLASFTIQDVEFSSNTGAGSESTATVHVPIEINTALPEDATVSYAVTGGTAASGVNYTLPSGTATIAAGSTSTTITLNVLVDHTFAGDKTVEVTLSNPSDNIRLGANKKFTYTIHDSDFIGYESHDIAVTPTNPGTEANSAQSSLSASSNYSYWTTALSTTDGGYDSQVFKFKPDLTGITNPSFTINWIGHGDVPEDKLVHIYVWNNTNSAWEEVASEHCSDDCTLSGVKVGTDYRDVDGYVWVWAKADNQSGAPAITDLSDNNSMLPITWSTGEINADSQLAYDQVSHPGTGTSTWDSYASHISDTNLVTSHSMTPTLPNNSTRNWSEVAYSTSSAVLFASVNGGDIFKSTDHGATFTDVTSAGTRSWSHITVSGDGTKVAAFDTNTGFVYYSLDGGSTWASSAKPGGYNPESLKYSGDGSHLFYASYQHIYVSTDNGANWSTSSDIPQAEWWTSVSSSYDGSIVYGIVGWDGAASGATYISTTTGATWTYTGFSTGNNWGNNITTSSNGSIVVVSKDYGDTYISPDAGVTWNVQNDPGSRWWYPPAISADGTHVILMDNNLGYIYTGVTADAGATWTWTTHTTPFGGQYWQSASLSNDGTHMTAVAYNSDLYTSDDSGATWVDRTGTTWYYRVKSVTADGDVTISEERSLVYNLNSSCPFIFTYDGSKYNFIIDASSAATLGSGGDLDLWKANPFYKATSYPNPLSYVKIPHGSLVPRTVGNENFYDIKTTFELNETNYYDQAALKVIDHDPNLDVYPDYRNTNVIHTISNTATAPVLVTDSHGQDVTSKIAANDNVYWHSSPTDLPAYLTIKLANGSTTPAHLKLVIKRGKHGNQTGGQGSDKLQYKNSAGVFVNLPTQYDPFTSTRAGAPAASRNFSNTYGVDTKVIDLSGLTIKDNTIRLNIANTTLQWDIDWLQVDTSADQAVTVTDLAPYYADLHFRGVSEQVLTNPSDKAMDITQPNYDRLAKTVGAANPLVGNATKFGDVTELLAAVDDKTVIAVQGDELALKYRVPAQAPGTVRDFIYKSWDYHKSYHAPLGDEIGPLPFNAMSQYPYHENVEHYPTDIDHTNYQSEYNTREINWGVVNSSPAPHHSLNTDLIELSIDSSVYGVTATAGTTTATIEWSTNVVSSSQVFFGPNTSYMSSTDLADTSPRVTSHSMTLTGLVPCSTYHFYVQSVRANEESSVSTDRVFTTLGCSGGATPLSIVSQTAASTTGATATSSQSGTGITVVVPPDFSSTTSSVELQIKSLSGSITLGNLGNPPSKSSVGTVVFDVKALIDQTTTLDSFDLPVTITMTYSDSDVVGINPSSLWIYHYHDGSWQRLDSCTVNTGTRTISCTTPNFSIFGLFGTASSNQVVSTGGSQGGGGGGTVYGCTDRNATNFTVGVASNSNLCKYSNTAVNNTVTAPSVGSTVSSKSSVSKSLFTRNLYKGMKGKDVTELQKYLIAQNAGPFAKKLAKNGTSTLFGALTESALKEFQKINKILPATGAFGPKTRGFVSK